MFVQDDGKKRAAKKAAVMKKAMSATGSLVLLHNRLCFCLSLRGVAGFAWCQFAMKSRFLSC